MGYFVICDTCQCICEVYCTMNVTNHSICWMFVDLINAHNMFDFEVSAVVFNAFYVCQLLVGSGKEMKCLIQ